MKNLKKVVKTIFIILIIFNTYFKIIVYTIIFESVDKHPVLNLKDFIVGKVGTNIDIYPVFVNTFLLIN